MEGKGVPTEGTPTLSDSPSLRRRSLQLPTPMRVEVRSPGFSSRLSSLVRENSGGNTSPFKAKRLQPPLAAAAFNPKYQGFGSLPRVKLERRSLPRLSAKNSPSMVKSPASRGEFWIMKIPTQIWKREPVLTCSKQLCALVHPGCTSAAGSS